MAEANDDQTPPAPTTRVPLKFWLYATLATLAVGGIGYGVAYGQGRGALSAVEAELASRVKAQEEARKDWDEQLGELRRKNALLAARSTLDAALEALEANNFGIAQAQLEQAGAAIAAQAGADEKLSGVATKLKAFRIKVSADIREQKSALGALLSSVDEALGSAN
jgi:hypothetical protein